MQSKLSERAKEMEKKWFSRVTGDYEVDTSRFLLTESDRFNNPVGYTFSHELHALYQEFIGSMDREAVMVSLEKILKIRSVQEFSPSAALRFVSHLKDLIHDEFFSEVKSTEEFSEFMHFERRVDELMLMSFDIYTSLRERLCDIRVKETKDMTAKLFERMNKLYGPREEK